MKKEQREQLRDDLKNHYGAFTEIAELAGVHHSYVYLVLNGKRKSTAVLTAACKVLAAREKVESEQSQLQLQLITRAKSYSSAPSA